MVAPVATLAVGNKLYSSWSMRPWLVLKHFQIPFEEVVVPLKQEDSKARIAPFSPTGLVPAYVHGNLRAWDSLAIIEAVADTHPALGIWPKDRFARAVARSVAAEMHSGFSALRSACPMNLGKKFAPKDRGEAVDADVQRIQRLWADCRSEFGRGGPFLFGAFTAADAMFAPVVSRFETYSVKVTPDSLAYMDAVQALPAYKAWVDAALDEPWTLPNAEVAETPVKLLRRTGNTSVPVTPLAVTS